MIHFKNNTQGFTFIEMMIALTLLAVFGTSIFLVQTSLLSKLFKTHHMVYIYSDISENIIELNFKIQQAILEKKEPKNISVTHTKQNPTRTVTSTMQPLSKESAMFKAFHTQTTLVKTTLQQDNFSSTWYTLQHIPQLKQEQEQPKGKTA